MSAQRYLVTARKYRPQLFSELVAQQHVTETLKNAIRLDRLAHAYLFSGPRGVGKTTAARILAKAINCTTPLEEREANAEPCRSCDSCRTFEEGRSLNIIEIDAASNNRVDDIRDLRETVRIPPQGGRKKVYIVDEVHMLSTAAFNALLKTLEEPPPHVLFIFATTEPHKVLPTILSRCQRFDFRRIAVPEITDRLTEICEEENIRADEASLMLIARKGDGALRDALSVFDQAVSLCGNDIEYAELAKALGVVEVDRYFEVTDLVAARDTGGMLRLVERTVRAGHDLQEFLSGLSEHLRNLLVARTMEDLDLIEAAQTTRARYGDAVADFTESDLLRLLTVAADAEDAIKGATQPRLKVETTLLKMASITLGADLRTALSKIDRLEEMARRGELPTGDLSGETSSSAPADAPSRTPSRVPADTPKRSTPKKSTAKPSDASRSTPDQNTANPSPPKSKPPKTDAEPPVSGASREPTPASSDAEATARSARTAAPGAAGSTTTLSLVDEPSPKHLGDGTSSTPPPEESPQPATSPKQSPGSGASDLLGKPALRRPSPAEASTDDNEAEPDRAPPDRADAGPITGAWDELLEAVKNDKIQVWSLLHHTEPEAFDDGVVQIAVPNDFHRRVLTSQSSYVLGHLEELVDVSIRTIQFSIRESMDETASQETASDFDPYEYMKRKREENPVVRAIFDQFGGELVW
ncbi:MAG: DNA polymerase III subunit gamma/tau [Rhodothermales bacterium]